MNFDKNWNNKLDCSVFTTIRKYDKDKALAVGRTFGEKESITLQREHYCFAVLLWEMKR